MPTPSIHKTARFGALAIAAVWLAVAGVLYLVFERIEQNRQASLKPYALSSGDLVLNDVSVTVGLKGMPPQQALLGQAFLKHFDVEIRRDEMVLRQRP
jgi:hypothetical protein